MKLNLQFNLCLILILIFKLFSPLVFKALPTSYFERNTTNNIKCHPTQYLINSYNEYLKKSSPVKKYYFNVNDVDEIKQIISLLNLQYKVSNTINKNIKLKKLKHENVSVNVVYNDANGFLYVAVESKDNIFYKRKMFKTYTSVDDLINDPVNIKTLYHFYQIKHPHPYTASEPSNILEIEVEDNDTSVKSYLDEHHLIHAHQKVFNNSFNSTKDADLQSSLPPDATYNQKAVKNVYFDDGIRVKANNWNDLLKMGNGAKKIYVFTKKPSVKIYEYTINNRQEGLDELLKNGIYVDRTKNLETGTMNAANYNYLAYRFNNTNHPNIDFIYCIAHPDKSFEINKTLDYYQTNHEHIKDLYIFYKSSTFKTPQQQHEEDLKTWKENAVLKPGTYTGREIWKKLGSNNKILYSLEKEPMLYSDLYRRNNLERELTPFYNYYNGCFEFYYKYQKNTSGFFRSASDEFYFTNGSHSESDYFDNTIKRSSSIYLDPFDSNKDTKMNITFRTYVHTAPPPTPPNSNTRVINLMHGLFRF